MIEWLIKTGSRHRAVWSSIHVRCRSDLVSRWPRWRPECRRTSSCCRRKSSSSPATCRSWSPCPWDTSPWIRTTAYTTPASQVCVQPPSSAVSVTLPAFAAERWLLQHGACSARSIYPAHRAFSSKPAGRRCCCRSMGQTDRETDGHSTVTYRVGQKRKLLILSEYVNKTEKTGGTWTNTNSCRENEALSDIFMWNILRHNKFFMFKYSMTVLIIQRSTRPQGPYRQWNLKPPLYMRRKMAAWK